MSINDGLQTSNGSKFHYGLWRPVTAIRRGAEDGNSATEANGTWTTLHPTTPPYPSYAGNASTIGAASATVLASAFGGDDVAFDVDWSRYIPSAATRSYSSFSAAADEMADSRVYGGIHFSFDNDAGKQVGANVADYIIENLLKPRRTPSAFREVSTGLAPATAVESNAVGVDVGLPSPLEFCKTTILEVEGVSTGGLLV